MTGRVEILLATRNSTDYLEDMLDGLLAQTHDDFHLIVSDDLSEDGTVAMIEARAAEFRNPVKIIRRDTPSGSAQANFRTLLAQAKGDYVFTADHDDIWLPGKIARGLAMLQAAEARTGQERPLLYHCDLMVINAKGEVRAPSYWAFKSIDPSAGKALNRSVMHPTVTGCAMAMNRPLLDRLGDIPAECKMHDWWITLVAAAFGEVIADPEPQILYRIHGRNASRPRKVSPLASLFQLERAHRMRLVIRQRIEQARLFRDRYAAILPEAERQRLALLLSVPAAGFLGRRVRMIRGGFLWPGVWRNIVGLCFV
ncbi:glycosyltransferase family 2 protein [Mangrovicoccus sp. HB161399]|uniref:glycosyltransferase family 2 protein n=1 Tax=Mangrovicoccus sp. HB161399 TaxID=2720392 RepID=UPI001554F8B9|nr:glycosyltransferase family 2 protein [Mangrovicoccus sp. HB161399]